MKVTYNSDMLSRAHSSVCNCCLLAIILLLIGSGGGPFGQRAYAQQLQGRSLNVQDVTAGATTRHTFRFSYATTSIPVGSLMFEYCTSPLLDLPCNAPSGINASNTVLAQQLGEGGYFILTRQTNRIILTRAPSLPPAVNPSQYAFDTIVNPTGAPGPFYVRITTYLSTDGSGAYTDFGAVVSATTQGLLINSEVPPYLKFCVGVTITGDCGTADGNLVDMGDLTPSKVVSGTSQMLAATNAEFGMVIAMYGTTMTSGNNIITALATPTVSAPGNAQFGLNLRDNSNPNTGINPSGGSATPASRYNVPDRYSFASGDTIVQSNAPSDTSKLTATYITNVPPGQQPGVYTATLTYICTATF
jgi:hypothetical protein